MKAAFVILIASLAICSTARAEVFASRYAVSLAGVRIGDATVQATLGAKRYKVEMSADVTMLLVNTRIRGETMGSRAGAKLTPERFQLVTAGGEESAVNILFTDSAAPGAKTLPQLRGFLDPLSALLLTSLRPPKPAHPCNTVLPIVMGRNRFDVTLRLKPAKEAQKEPSPVTCEIVSSASGPQDGPWEIGFTKLAKPHFWLIDHIAVPTPNGTMTIDRAETAISGS